MEKSNYDASVAALRKSTVAALASARGDQTILKEPIAAYLRKGYQADVTAGELTDLFCVDSPSILEDAGFSDSDADSAVEIFDKLHPVIRQEFKRPL